MEQTIELSPCASRLPLGSLSEAYAYCRRITRRSSSNFYVAFRLLSAERHNALCALYAFCRFIDDIADQPTIGESSLLGKGKKERLEILLNAWREELRHCYGGMPRHPISLALSDTVQRFPIQQAHLAGIIDGVEMDLRHTHYRTFEELYDYCYHVASLVGLACIEIFGYRNPSAREYAVDLGIAFQLTNILRDVGEDVQRGRVYLPEEDMVQFGYTEQDLLREIYNKAFVQLMTFEANRAREYYNRALRNRAPEDQRSLVAAEAMRLIYSRLLETLVQRRFDVFSSRVTLPSSRKVQLAFQAWARGWFGLL